MKRIALTQGQFAIVDDEDFEWLNQWKWSAWQCPWSKGYYAVRVSYDSGVRQNLRMHRQILGLEFGDKRQGDHIHHNTLDNRRDQLRIVTNRQNSHNRKKPGTSQHPGVSWDKERNRWQVNIQIKGHNQKLGRFLSETAAAQAYQVAIKEL
jgi:hypothetical protein